MDFFAAFSHGSSLVLKLAGGQGVSRDSYQGPDTRPVLRAARKSRCLQGRRLVATNAVNCDDETEQMATGLVHSLQAMLPAMHNLCPSDSEPSYGRG